MAQMQFSKVQQTPGRNVRKVQKSLILSLTNFKDPDETVSSWFSLFVTVLFTKITTMLPYE